MTGIALAGVGAVMLGLMAGFFYAFSVCVMPGLGQIDPSEAIRAMQAINLAVRNGVFFAAFFLTPVVCGAAAAVLAWSGRRRAATILAAAALIYVLGAMGPTVAVNVPLNRALAAVDASGGIDPARIWADYLAVWDRWNLVRTLASTLALAVAGWALASAGTRAQDLPGRSFSTS